MRFPRPLCRTDIAVMLPIHGTSSVQHLEENVAAAALSLDDSEMSALERG